MKKLYYIYFLRLKDLFEVLGEKDIPKFYAMSFISLNLYFNIATVIGLIELKFYPNFVDKYSIPLGILTFVANYFIFFYKKRFEKISKAGDLYLKNKWKVVTYLSILIYFFTSITMWIIIGYNIRQMNIS